MFKTINNIINYIIPYTPKFLIKIFANQYVAGTTIEKSLDRIEALNNKGLSATIDILGEHTENIVESDLITNQYCEILTKINERHLDCNISIKPSHIGTDIDHQIFLDNLQKIQTVADSFNNFVRIDMEDSKLTQITLDAYHQTSKSNTGTVLQAYLHRTLNDLNRLSKDSNVRLCKGIYNENATIAFKKRNEINQNYLLLLKAALNKKIYVGIATHDPFIIEESLKHIKQLKIDKKLFEFQMLYGVPMSKYINKISAEKYKIRIYVPFGENWYDYSIRRIKENPNISKYIIQNLFKK